MSVTVRPREARDIPALGQVLIRVHALDGYPVEGVADPEACLTPPHELAAWTAEHAGQPIGHVSLTRATTDDDAAAVWSQATGKEIKCVAIPVRLFIDPDHRQHGGAFMLLEAVQAYAKQHNLTIVFDVMLKDRTAIRIYEALGCERLGTIDHHHSGGQVEPAAVYVAPH